MNDTKGERFVAKLGLATLPVAVGLSLLASILGHEEVAIAALLLGLVFSLTMAGYSRRDPISRVAFVLCAILVVYLLIVALSCAMVRRSMAREFRQRVTADSPPQ